MNPRLARPLAIAIATSPLWLLGCAVAVDEGASPPTGTGDASHLDSSHVDTGEPADTRDAADTSVAPGPDTSPDATTDSGAPETALPDTTAVDTALPDTTVADTALPDTTVADTALPDTTTGADASDACTGTGCATACPTGLVLGAFTTTTDGWVLDGLWSRDASNGGVLVAGSSYAYSSSYTQNAMNGSNVDLSGCSVSGTPKAMLGYRVRLDDDPDYASKSADKSERLYVECSGDGGGTWTSLVPNPWPANQSACATSYCDGYYGFDRSFAWTTESIALPAACVTKTARVRFRATGKSAWNLMSPGWWIDTVTIN